jgi:hypothetical protein
VIALAAASSSATSAWDQPGTLGFLVVFGLCVIMYFVFKSMSKHLKKVRDAAYAEEVAAAKADGTVTLSDDTVSASPSGNGVSPQI